MNSPYCCCSIMIRLTEGAGYRVTDSHDSGLLRSCEYRQCMKMVYRVLKAGRLGGNNTVQHEWNTWVKEPMKMVSVRKSSLG